MIEEDMSPCIFQAQTAAHAGHKPHEIVDMLFNSITAQYGAMFMIRLEVCLRKAFDIPLKVVRDIEPWQGFPKMGTMTNQELDNLLHPWIQRYLDISSDQ